MGVQMFRSIVLASAAASLALFSFNVSAQSAVTRDGVATTVLQACNGERASCVSTVTALLSEYGDARCRPEDRLVAQGIADAIVKLSEANTDLAVDLTTLVIQRGSDCFELAFAEVVDGSGTAEIDDPTAGSPG
jgi:hypothetical protein